MKFLVFYNFWFWKLWKMSEQNCGYQATKFPQHAQMKRLEQNSLLRRVSSCFFENFESNTWNKSDSACCSYDAGNCGKLLKFRQSIPSILSKRRLKNPSRRLLPQVKTPQKSGKRGEAMPNPPWSADLTPIDLHFSPSLWSPLAEEIKSASKSEFERFAISIHSTAKTWWQMNGKDFETDQTSCITII